MASSSFAHAVFPAHAGMDRKLSSHSPQIGTFSPHTRGWTAPRRAKGPRRRRFPRTRGDGPSTSCAAPSTWPFSPHTRGWTVDGEDVSDEDGVFPAHAGMDRALPGPADPTDPFSPHTRGWTGGEPVCAGGGSRFPRTRGDGPKGISHLGHNAGVFPAHAGMDRTSSGPSSGGSTFSPHTRGWTEGPRGHALEEARFPRTRGDGPSVIEEAAPLDDPSRGENHR